MASANPFETWDKSGAQLASLGVRDGKLAEGKAPCANSLFVIVRKTDNRSRHSRTVRAGLGVTVLPKKMVPTDLSILNDEALGLPDLKDTEMALLEAPDLAPAAARLRDTIIRELEH